MTKNLDSSFYLPHAGRDDDPERTQGGDSLPLLVGRLRSYYDQCAPHIRAREQTQLIKEAADYIEDQEALFAEFQAMGTDLAIEGERLRRGIESFYSFCRSACEVRKGCEAWTDRGMQCLECPKQYAEELQAHIEETFTSPEGQRAPCPVGIDKGDAPGASPSGGVSISSNAKAQGMDADRKD